MSVLNLNTEQSAQSAFEVRIVRAGVDWTNASGIGGIQLSLKMKPTDPLLQRDVYDNQQIINANSFAVSSGKKRRRELCDAVNVPYPLSDPFELLGRTLIVELDEKGNVKKYRHAEVKTDEAPDPATDKARAETAAADAETANDTEAKCAARQTDFSSTQLEPRSGLAKNVYDAYIACAKEHGTPDMINENDGCFYLEQKVWHDYFCEHGRSRKNETYTRKRDASRGFSAGLEALIARCDISTKDTGFSWRLADKFDTEGDRKEIIDVAKTRAPRKEYPVAHEWMLEAEHKAEAE